MSLFTVSAIICCTGAVVGFCIREEGGASNIDENAEAVSESPIKNTTPKPFQFFGYLLMLVMLGCTFGISLQFMPIFFDFMLKESWITAPISNMYFMTTTLITVAIVRLSLGRLSDGIHRDRMMNVCHVIMVLVLCGFAGIRSETSAFIAAVIFGLSYGLLYPAINTKLMGMAGKNERGKMSGWLAMFYEFGFRGLPMLLGSVVYYMSYVAMFYLLAIGYAFAVAILLYCKSKDLKTIPSGASLS